MSLKILPTRLILGKVGDDTSSKRAAGRCLFEDVPDPIFGKVPRKVAVKTLVRAASNRMWRCRTVSLYEGHFVLKFHRRSLTPFLSCSLP